MFRGRRYKNPVKKGLIFEKRHSLEEVFAKMKGYDIKEHDVFFKDKKVAEVYKQNNFYKNFLNEYGVDERKILSKKLLPDGAVYVIKNKTIYIVEIKFQQGEGSVDEKLQTCDFKRKQYTKLIKLLGLNLKLKYIYVLSNWFKKSKYVDVLNYIKEMNCDYFFEEIPMKYLNLPVQK